MCNSTDWRPKKHRKAAAIQSPAECIQLIANDKLGKRAKRTETETEVKSEKWKGKASGKAKATPTAKHHQANKHLRRKPLKCARLYANICTFPGSQSTFCEA